MSKPAAVEADVVVDDGVASAAAVVADVAASSFVVAVGGVVTGDAGVEARIEQGNNYTPSW